MLTPEPRFKTYSCVGCILHRSSGRNLHVSGQALQPSTWVVFPYFVQRHYMACPQSLSSLTLVPPMMTQVSGTNEVTEVMCVIAD